MVLLLLPVLFYMEATLAWTVLIAAGCITLVIAAFLKPLARMTAKLIQAESDKGSTLVESIYGIRTVKSLCLEGSARGGMGSAGGQGRRTQPARWAGSATGPWCW